MMIEDKVLKLESPIETATDKITELRFSRLKAKHLKGMSATPGFNELLDLVCKSTGVVPGLIGELDLPDAMKAVEIVSSFFGNGLKTGENS